MRDGATYLQQSLDGERGVPDLRAIGALCKEDSPTAATSHPHPNFPDLMGA